MEKFFFLKIEVKIVKHINQMFPVEVSFAIMSSCCLIDGEVADCWACSCLVSDAS